MLILFNSRIPVELNRSFRNFFENYWLLVNSSDVEKFAYIQLYINRHIAGCVLSLCFRHNSRHKGNGSV